MGGRKETTYNVDMFLRVGEVIGLAVPSDVCRSELTFPRRKGVLQYVQCRAIEGAEPGLIVFSIPWHQGCFQGGPSHGSVVLSIYVLGEPLGADQARQE